MKKKIFALVCCFVMMMGIFTGCSLFEENQERKLNQVVASVGDVSVTLEELIKSYSNNAQTLIQNYGYSAEDAVDYCINSLLARGVVFEIAKDMEEENKIVITDADRTKVMQDLVAYYGSLMNAYADEAMRDLDIESPAVADDDEPKEEEKKSDYTAETKFKQTYKYVVQKNEGASKVYSLAVQDLTKETAIDVEPGYVNVFKAFENGENITDALFKILDDSFVSPVDEAVKNKIYENVVIAYKTSYNHYKNLSDKEIIVSEMTKILKDYEKQLYIDKVGKYYTKTAYAELNNQAVVDNYLNKFNASMSLYENNLNAYVKAMLDSASKVYYHPADAEFGYVSHVLLKYSDEQDADLKLKKQILSNEEYDLYAKKQADLIKVKKYNENGEVVAEGLSPAQVLEEIQNVLASAKTAQERARIFNEYVYSVNMDTGNKNAEQDYTIGRELKEETDSRTKMVPEFTKGSRALIETYFYVQNGGDLATIDAAMKDKEEIEALEDGVKVELREEYKAILDNSIFIGEVGSMTGLVRTDYGYHIIMFTGVPSNMDLNNSMINSSRVKLEDVQLFGDAEWRTFASANSNRDLACVKLYNMVKEADSSAVVTLNDIKQGKVFSNVEINAMTLDSMTVNAHTSKTYLDDALTETISKISVSATNALYSNYVSSYVNTKDALMKNKSIYEYLYKA